MTARHNTYSRFNFSRSSTAVQVLSLVLFALVCASCNFTQSATTGECDPPAQDCQPGTWQGANYAGIASYGRPGIDFQLDFVTGINSPDNEFAVAFADGAVFATREEAGQQTLQDARVVSATSLKPASRLSFNDITMAGALNMRAGTAVMSAVGANAPKGDADLYRCTVAGASVRGLQKLGEPVSLPVFWDSQPALSPDGTILFFASDRPGGYGGTDIWYTVKDGNSWTAPFNCGSQINSRCDELTPFVTTDGFRLMFASAGHKTVGGYDLFIADIPAEFYKKPRTDQPSFGEARNIGAPINTTSDELFPCAPGRYDSLFYFSSNRPAPEQIASAEKGGFDLYVLHAVKSSGKTTASTTTTPPQIEPPQRRIETSDPTQNTSTKQNTRKTDPEKRVTVRGRVTESRTNKPVEGANVAVRDADDQSVIDRSQTDSNGRFSLQVPVEREVEISAQGKHLFYDTQRIRISDGSSNTVVLRDFSLPGDLTLRINFPNDEYSNPYQYLLDSNGTPTTQTWQEALDLLAENLKLYKDHIKRLILVGHTDDVASDAYNKLLGMRRARFVVNELVQRGVPVSKLEAQSSGEEHLLPRRENESDDQYRIRCRRVDLLKEMRFILPGGN